MSTFTYNGHTYVVVTQTFNWDDARSNAETMGGHLAKIDSASENAAIYDFLMSISAGWSDHYIAPDGGGSEYVWIGASDAAQEGNWRWSDGSALGYTNWGFGGEPDNYNGNQNGAAIALEGWPYGKGTLGHPAQWNDINTTNGLFSIVEYDGLAGTAGNDKIKGTVGRDTLFGLGGKDTLTGGKGKDTFVFNTEPSKANIDKITDFNAKDDSIWLDDAVFTKLGSGSLSAPKKLKKAYFEVGSKAGDKNDYLIYNKKTGILSYDADGSGSGKAIQIAALKKGLALTHADFFVV